MNLCDLAVRYGTDKYPYHSYCPYYEQLFRGRTVRRLLEIGIGTRECMSHIPNYQPGASLRMWRDYFPEAHIYGFDIDPTVLFQEERIHTHQADSRNVNSLSLALWDLFPGKLPKSYITEGFDVIIDDTFHDPLDQITTAQNLLCWIEHGLYIIEDVRENAAEIVQHGIKALGYPSRVVEFDIARVPDDRLVIIEF